MDILPIAALWGGAVIAQKYSLRSVKPGTSLIIVSLLHTLFILGYLSCNWETFSQDVPNITNRLSAVLLVGVAASFIGNIMYYKALDAYSAPVVSSVVSTVPLFVTLYAFALLGTQMSLKKVIGILIVLLGINLLR